MEKKTLNKKKETLNLNDINAFYVFKSKPKIVPLLKKITGLSYFIIFLLWYIVLGILLAILSSLNTYNSVTDAKNLSFILNDADSDIGIIVYKGIDSANHFLYQVIYKNLWTTFWFILPLSMLYFVFRGLKKEKYENNVYSVSVLSFFLQAMFCAYITYQIVWMSEWANSDELILKSDLYNSSADSEFFKSALITFTAVELVKGAEEVKNSFYAISHDELWSNSIWIVFFVTKIITTVGVAGIIISYGLMYVMQPEIDNNKIGWLRNQIKKKIAETFAKSKPQAYTPPTPVEDVTVVYDNPESTEIHEDIPDYKDGDDDENDS